MRLHRNRANIDHEKPGSLGTRLSQRRQGELAHVQVQRRQPQRQRAQQVQAHQDRDAADRCGHRQRSLVFVLGLLP